jgi:hypothetical protein
MSLSRQTGGQSTGETKSAARRTADNLARAYQLQDELESKKRLSEKRKTETATRAYERMGDVYCREFPEIPTEDARQAGHAHMDGLFKQDIIENDPTNSTVKDVLTDDRWRQATPWNVKDSLTELCELVAMDDQFAGAMTEFFRLHGQKQDGWKQQAYRAHKIKTTQITGSETWGKKLAPYFVIAVMHHDTRAWSTGREIIQAHYELLFDLTGGTV